MSKHEYKDKSGRGSSQQAPDKPKGDPMQEPIDASTEDDCASADSDLDPKPPKDTPEQAPTESVKQARPSPTKQEPLGPFQAPDKPKGDPKHDPLDASTDDDCAPSDPEPKTDTPKQAPAEGVTQSHTEALMLEVVLRSYSLLLRDMTTLSERLDEIEMALGHVATRTYAPSNPRVRDALACVRARAQHCIKESRPPEASVPMTSPRTLAPEPARGSASFARTRELGERVLAAAARARGRRDEADRLASSRAPAEEITEALRVAEEAETEAFATAEEANAELLG